jgi:glycosyltransferase involved in cell wall biosynthesis
MVQSPMTAKFSVVIVCKNEADIIGRVLDSVQPLTDDIIIYDNGSTDGTLDIISGYSVNLHRGPWLGYGKTKQHAVNLAKHDWVLSIDADEALDKDLQEELQSLSFADGTVYQIRFKNFLGDKCLQWGEWGHDKHVRIFNRKAVNWNEADIHEELVIPGGIKIKRLRGHILHYTMKDIPEYSRKVVHYALLNAEKYFRQGKKAGFVKRYINPGFAFNKHYFFQLGFLDGWEGLISACMTSYYTFLKYARLHELWHQRDRSV